MGHHDDERQPRDKDDNERRLGKKPNRHDKKPSRRDKKHEEKRSRTREGEHRHRRSHSSDGSSSGRDHKRRKKEKKQRKKDRKHRNKQHKEDRSREEESDSCDRLERNFAFSDALYELVELQPGMASELPILLIRMAEGTSFSLNQMPDARVSIRLQRALATLSSFGVQKDETGSWMWKSPSGGSRGTDPLLLLKIVRALLDEIGVTMDAVENYSKPKETVVKEVKTTDDATRPAEDDSLSVQTISLLERFSKESDGPSLAHELASLCQVILGGESISLDGLADTDLRIGIERLFQEAGLEKSEIDASNSEEESDSEDDNDEPVTGYGLPDDNQSDASARLKLILETCKASDSNPQTTKRPLRGPAVMPFSAPMAGHILENDDSDDDDDGPAPAGSEKAKKRVLKGPTLPPEVVKAMADRTKGERGSVATGMEMQAGSTMEREQWMMEPGEHDFLQGIVRSGATMKSRNFQNKKQSGPATEAAAAPMNPTVQAELAAIYELHREARGPSLMDQHKMKIAEEKEAKAKEGGKAEWGWKRDNDLDAGRRVDKTALNMIMGGAATNLKDKFQGGYSRGFT